MLGGVISSFAIKTFFKKNWLSSTLVAILVVAGGTVFWNYQNMQDRIQELEAQAVLCSERIRDYVENENEYLETINEQNETIEQFQEDSQTIQEQTESTQNDLRAIREEYGLTLNELRNDPVSGTCEASDGILEYTLERNNNE